MFYQKYRPQILAEIDNQIVREKIKKILLTKRLPHAMLFAGPKGTGKTSTARIFSKAINCLNNFYSEKNNTIEPCNQCPNCKSITTGSSPDVIEIDAASNRGIDEIREIIEKIKFYPLQSRYKIYIIDEAHMLTKEAFNALLKTLEEPPNSTIFILATTEPEKMPNTIISRCLKIVFSKAKTEEIYNMLKRITAKEKLNFSDKLLTTLAKHADHSFRDAAKILEELAIEFQNNPKSDPESLLNHLLGYRGNYLDLIDYLEKKDQKKALDFIENYDKNGGDFKSLIESSLDFFHQLLLKKNGLVSEPEKDYRFSIKEISLLIKLLHEAYRSLKYSPIEALPLEIAIIDYCQTEGGEKKCLIH